MAFEIKRNDLRPRFRVQLTANGSPVDLTDATSVKFLMTNSDQSVSVTGAAAFVDRTTGIVEYVWKSGDTSTPGDYNIEFEVLWGTEPQTFPSSGYFTAKINADLG